MKLLFSFILFILCVNVSFAQLPAVWQFSDSQQLNGEKGVELRLSLENNYYIYAESVTIEAFHDSKLLTDVLAPIPKQKWDALQDTNVYVFQGGSIWFYPHISAEKTVFKIAFQGCESPKSTDDLGRCFFPEEVELGFSPKTNQTKSEDIHFYLNQIKNDFIIKKQVNYGLDENGLLSFLSHDSIASESINFNAIGVGLILILILLGGLSLNLTPCVLPMIPINLAIIGAGKQATSRFSGFFRGLLYGAGIAISYGVLGVLAIFFGESLGVLNASWWFNLMVAIIMFIFALATFEVLHIDFSRFQTWSPKVQSHSRTYGLYIGIFMMGSLAAVLSGACVAPILSSTLLYTIAEWNNGNWFAIMMPFALGVGMALPWPLAGAGFAMLPKPGAWMLYVKRVMGSLILLVAIYFGYQAFQMYENDVQHDNLMTLNNAIAMSKRTHKPILIDFYASWCAACRQMDQDVFPLPTVQKALDGYIFVKLYAEDPKAPDVAPLLHYFNLVGLPALIILEPKD